MFWISYLQKATFKSFVFSGFFLKGCFSGSFEEGAEGPEVGHGPIVPGLAVIMCKRRGGV